MFKLFQRTVPPLFSPKEIKRDPYLAKAESNPVVMLLRWEREMYYVKHKSLAPSLATTLLAAGIAALLGFILSLVLPAYKLFIVVSSAVLVISFILIYLASFIERLNIYRNCVHDEVHNRRSPHRKLLLDLYSCGVSAQQMAEAAYFLGLRRSLSFDRANRIVFTFLYALIFLGLGGAIISNINGDNAESLLIIGICTIVLSVMYIASYVGSHEDFVYLMMKSSRIASISKSKFLPSLKLDPAGKLLPKLDSRINFYWIMVGILILFCVFVALHKLREYPMDKFFVISSLTLVGCGLFRMFENTIHRRRHRDFIISVTAPYLELYLNKNLEPDSEDFARWWNEYRNPATVSRKTD